MANLDMLAINDSDRDPFFPVYVTAIKHVVLFLISRSSILLPYLVVPVDDKLGIFVLQQLVVLQAKLKNISKY